MTDTVRDYVVIWRSSRTSALQLAGVFNDAIVRCQQLLQARQVTSVAVVDVASRKVVYQFRRDAR
ncbi:MAG: hypothetical protein ACRDT4_26620 [Micromonosporaceae bacterium]